MQQQTKGRTYQTDSGTATVPNLMGKLPMGDVALSRMTVIRPTLL